jgi:aromatic-L-amino-acid decarboxylase
MPARSISVSDSPFDRQGLTAAASVIFQRNEPHNSSGLMKKRTDDQRSDAGIAGLGDVPPEEFRRQLHQLADWIADYRENIGQLAVAPKGKPGTLVAALPTRAPERGESFEAIMADLDNIILPGVLHWGHPQFMGYFGSTNTAPGLEGEMLSAAFNVNAMTWRTCPAATELETVVLDWLRQWLDLPNDFGGVVYDTASVGILHALAVAREEAAADVRKLGVAGRADVPRFRIYASDQAHSSADKAAIALGIGEENVRRVPTDSEFRLNLPALGVMVAQDLRDKFKPLAVVATVGTTSTASVDPVPALAAICREHGMWLHIDGAYGAGLAVLPEHAWVKAGWHEADSIIINPHKMLFVPFDFSVLYVRDMERLRRVFTLVPDYLRGDTLEAEKNYMDYGVQLGRRFRALKAWMVFRTFGREGIAARIREHLRLAQLLAGWIESDKRFELAAPVIMGVVCFRVAGANQAVSDSLNSSIVEGINASGRAYLGLTKLRGRPVMRIGLGNVLTTEQHLQNVWKLIQETAARAL